MNEVETITWRDLTGNKYNKTLHPAMLSEQGFMKQVSIRRIGDVKKTVFRVVYDRDYVVEYLEKKIVKNLAAVDLCELIGIFLAVLTNVNKSLTVEDIRQALDEVTTT